MAQKETEVIKKRIESLKKHIKRKSMLDKLTTIIEYEVMNLNFSPEMIGVIMNGRGNILRKLQTEEFEVPEDWFDMSLNSESLVQKLRTINIKKFFYFVEEYRKRNPGNLYTDYGGLFIELYKDRYEGDFQDIERSYKKFANDELELMLNYTINGQRIDLLLSKPESLDEMNVEGKENFDKQKEFVIAILKNLSKTGCLKDLIFSENKNIRQMNNFFSDENKIPLIKEDDIFKQIVDLDFGNVEDRAKLVVFARTYANKLAHNYDDYIIMNIEANSKMTDSDGRITSAVVTYDKLSEIMRDYDKAIRANRANEIDVPSFSEFFRDVLESQNRGDGFEFSEIEKRNGDGTQNIAKNIKNFLKSVQNNFENPEQLFIDITKKMEFADRLFEVKNRYTRVLVDCFSQESPYFMENFLPEGDDGVVDVYLDGYMQAFGGHYKSYDTLAEEYDVQTLPKIPKTVSFSFFESDDGHSFSTFVPLNKLTDAQRADCVRLWETIEAVENGTVDESKEYFKLDEVKRVFGVKKSADLKREELNQYLAKRVERDSYHAEAAEKKKEMQRIKSSANSKSDEARQRMSELQREQQLLKNKAKKIDKEDKVDINIPRLETELRNFRNEDKFFEVLKLRTALAIGIDFYKEKYALERVVEDNDKKLNPEQMEMAKICLEYIKAGCDINLFAEGGMIEIKDTMVIDYCSRHGFDTDGERTQDETEHNELGHGNR